MDHVTVDPAVLSSESDSSDLRGGTEPRDLDRLSPEDLEEVRFTDLLEIGEYMTRYHLLDVPKEDSVRFGVDLTTRRDAWFIRAGDLGLIYLTNVVPEAAADFHAVFWDKRLGMDRVAAVKVVLADAFDRFALRRISAHVPVYSVPMRRFLQDAGFVLEGVTRHGWSFDPPVDVVHYGMLLEERPWPVLPLGGE